MFCSKCGAEIPDGSRFCPSCGAPIEIPGADHSSDSNSEQKDTAQEKNTDSGSYAVKRGGGPLITTKRGMVKYVIFTIITFGIYSLYFYHAMARDLNIMCEGDGRKTTGLVKLILLSIITCSIYYFYWYYKFAERVQDNGSRYGVTIKEGGSTVLLWMIVGSFLCGIGSFVSLHIFIRNFNTLAEAYNQRQ